MLPRFARLLLVNVLAVLFVFLLNFLLRETSASQLSARGASAPTSETTLTATSTELVSVTALLTTSAATLNVGDAFTVTTQLVTTGTCGFRIYNVTLSQTAPLFTYIDPPLNMIGPSRVNPVIWRLATRQTGVTALTVNFYGEIFCGGWQLTTIHSESQPVTVTGVAHFLPFAPRTVTPARLTDLGTLGGKGSTAYAINDHDQVVGDSVTVGIEQHAILWQNGAMTDLGTLGGNYSYAIAINDRGQVVGASETANKGSHAFMWQDGIMTDLGALGEGGSAAVDINHHGQVIGNSPTTSFEDHGFLWANGIMTDLGTLGGNMTTVTDINDRGQIVGSSKTADGSYHAFLWEDGIMTDLNLAIEEYYSEAAAINERGQVVGTYGISGDGSVGFLWEKGKVKDFSNSRWYGFRIEDFNERGQAVGSYSLDGTSMRSFLWADGVMTDLDAPKTLDLIFCPARINEAGVVALYRDSDDELQGPVLWNDSGFILLPTLGGEYPTCTQDINNLGRVAGQSSPGYGVVHAVLWETVAGE